MLLSDSLTALEIVWDKTWRYISEDLVYHQRKEQTLYLIQVHVYYIFLQLINCIVALFFHF